MLVGIQLIHPFFIGFLSSTKSYSDYPYNLDRTPAIAGLVYSINVVFNLLQFFAVVLYILIFLMKFEFYTLTSLEVTFQSAVWKVKAKKCFLSKKV